jgi:hypothetical protein
MKMHEEHLGDGLYASFNGYQFCLRAPRELSDYQRSLLKLPTRGRPDGWIIDEILAWEKYRLEAMPLIMAVEASESGFREKCENPPFPLSGLSLEPGKKNYERKANYRHPGTMRR